MTGTLCVLVLLVSLASAPSGTSPSIQAQQDEQLAGILETISKTTQEGEKVIDRIQDMKPEVNDQESTRTLTEMVQIYAFNHGVYNINVIGWSASRKGILRSETVGRWKVVLYYRDWQKDYQAAEWEYNLETNKLYPFEKENAPGFWSNEG